MNPTTRLEWSLAQRLSTWSTKWSNCRFGTLQDKKGSGRTVIDFMQSYHLTNWIPLISHAWVTLKMERLKYIFMKFCCMFVSQVSDQELLQGSSRSTVGLWHHKVNQPILVSHHLCVTSLSFFVQTRPFSVLSVCLHSRETYNALTTWLSDARMLASQNIVIILCGNKKDLDADREVTFLEASRFAQENGTSPICSLWSFH